MNINKDVLTKREKSALQRIDNAKKATELVQIFFSKGFKSLVAILSITKYYYPNLTTSEINNFWHFRNVSDDILVKMEMIIEKLNAE